MICRLLETCSKKHSGKGLQTWDLHGDVGQKMFCHFKVQLLKSSDVYFSS